MVPSTHKQFLSTQGTAPLWTRNNIQRRHSTGLCRREGVNQELNKSQSDLEIEIRVLHIVHNGV